MWHPFDDSRVLNDPNASERGLQKPLEDLHQFDDSRDLKDPNASERGLQRPLEVAS